MESLCISYVSASATNFFFSRGSGKKKKRKRDQPQRQRSSTPTTPVSADVATPEVSDDEESNVRVDIADIVEVREGFATDTFNEAAKNADNLKIATHLKVFNQRSLLKPWQYCIGKYSLLFILLRPRIASRLSSLPSSVDPTSIWCPRTLSSPRVGCGLSTAF